MKENSDNETASGYEQRDFSVFDSLQIPVFATDKTRRVVYANGAFALLVGRAGERIEGIPIDSLIKSETSGVARALAGDASSVVTWATIKNRKYFFEYRTTPIYDSGGNIAGVFETIDDLTDRQTALQAVEELVYKAKAGQLSARIDLVANGDYGIMVNDVNEMLDALITPLNEVSDYIDRLSRGDIPAQITGSYRGDFKSIKDGLNRCIKTISGIAGEINNLKRVISDGIVMERRNASMYQGAFKEMIQDINGLIEGVIIPLDELLAALGRKAFN